MVYLDVKKKMRGKKIERKKIKRKMCFHFILLDEEKIKKKENENCIKIT